MSTLLAMDSRRNAVAYFDTRVPDLKDTKRQSRVRWAKQEVDAVLRRCAELQTARPDWSAKRVLEAAQAVLPPPRRRSAYPALVAWMNKHLSKREKNSSTEIASTAPARRAESATPPIRIPDPDLLSADPVIGALVERGIRLGSAVLMGVLQDAGVRKAISELVTKALHGATDISKAIETDSNSPQADSTQQEILLVGLTDDQAREFSRTYRDVLVLRFDNGTSITPGLRAAASRADLVIAIDRTVSSEVSRLLHQITPSYIRHTSGLVGLRQRLAELAMTAVAAPRMDSEGGSWPDDRTIQGRKPS